MGEGDEDSETGTTTSREANGENITVKLGGHTGASMAINKDEEHGESPTGASKADVEEIRQTDTWQDIKKQDIVESVDTRESM